MYINSEGYIIKGQQGSLWFISSWQEKIHLDLKFENFVEKTKSYWFHKQDKPKKYIFPLNKNVSLRYKKVQVGNDQEMFLYTDLCSIENDN